MPFTDVIRKEQERSVTATWLTTLKTETPQASWELALKLSRVTVKAVQQFEEVWTQIRAAYDHHTATSQVIATNFQTVAAANSWWR